MPNRRGMSISEIVDLFVQRRARIRRLKQEEKADKKTLTESGFNVYFNKKYMIRREVKTTLELDETKLLEALGSEYLKDFYKEKKHVHFLVMKRPQKVALAMLSTTAFVESESETS